MNDNLFDEPASDSEPGTDILSPVKIKQINIWHGFQTVVIVGVIIATLFTMWTPANIFSNNALSLLLNGPSSVSTPSRNWPTITPAPRPKIGVVAGHFGNDPGSVCSDGLQEVQVNLQVASMVQKNLSDAGFDVDLLQEFDERLPQYQALALVSIHADSCDYINNDATGFKVAAATSNPHPERSARLAACLMKKYEENTHLQFHAGSITEDMREYHTFSEINNLTTAAIIETGFLNLDREMLTKHLDVVAKGISDGILCFIYNESAPVDMFLQQP
jgi:N-acetylmuramoyl-L-alanine amidase